MKRRDFLKTTALMTLMPVAAFAADDYWTHYRPGVVDAALRDGQTVFLDFSAKWCGTCKAQERRITGLVEENPAYTENVLFVRVDWDAYMNAAITFDLEIPRRSTLVVLKGDEELGRNVAGTSRDAIKGLMDVALEAATS